MNALDAALVKDGELVSANERAAIDSQASYLKTAVAGASHRAIRDATEKLDLVTKPFAERRMNRSMTDAMSGRALSDVDEQLSPKG